MEFGREDNWDIVIPKKFPGGTTKYQVPSTSANLTSTFIYNNLDLDNNLMLRNRLILLNFDEDQIKTVFRYKVLNTPEEALALIRRIDMFNMKRSLERIDDAS